MKPCGLFFKHLHNAFEKILKKKNKKMLVIFFEKVYGRSTKLNKNTRFHEIINGLPNAIDCNVLPSKLQPVKHFKAEFFFFFIKAVIAQLTDGEHSPDG